MINDAFGVDGDKINEVPVASNVEIDRDEDEDVILMFILLSNYFVMVILQDKICC
jgi:hypothetical protein